MKYGMRTGKRTRAKPPTKRRNVVASMAARGYNADVIAARLGVNKNTLRAKHALELQRGREVKKAEKERAAARQLSKKEQERLSVITASFNSHWYDAKLGNLLFGNTHSIAEALEWCKRFNSRWI